MTKSSMAGEATHPAKVIDGKAFALDLRDKITAQVSALKANHDVTPGLAVIIVGEDPASQVYVRNKNRATEKAGMNSWQHTLPSATSQEELLTLIDKLNNDDAVDGILVQLPVPDHINADAIINAIDPDKDVDGFHAMNMGRLLIGQPGLVPCTPQGCLMLIQDVIGEDLSGKKAVIIGRSNIVGKPMAVLLNAANATATIAHSRTQDLVEECKQADILVAAIGKPKFIQGDWIKPGAIVIDVGINRIEDDQGNAKLVGDVDYTAAAQVASAITPVPGGVGPMTIACLLNNTLQAAHLRRGITLP